MYRLSRAEMETVIRYDAEERIAHIDTAMPAIVRKLDKLAEAYPDVYRCVGVDDRYGAKRYEVDARFIRFGKPASEARKAVGRANMERMLTAKKNEQC